MYSADFYHRPPQHHNTITLDPADTHFSYLNTILGCWTLIISSSECSTNTVTSTQKNYAIFIYIMLLFLLRRVNYIRFFITYYTFSHFNFLRMSRFNKELLTYSHNTHSLKLLQHRKMLQFYVYQQLQMICTK